MKKVFLLILIFHSVLSNCQIKSGIVEYELIIGENKDMETGPMKDYYSDAKKNAKYLTYNLEFNETEMLFYQNPNLNTDGTDTSFSVAFSGVDGKYYREKNSNTVLNEKDNKLIGKVIVKKDEKPNWTLTKETKKIQNYLCYKATTVAVVTNKMGTFKREVIVWYCPKLPFSYGPNGFGGLPGLILEYQDRNVVLGAKKINLKKVTSTIKKPSKGKIISEEELNKMIDKAVMERR